MLKCTEKLLRKGRAFWLNLSAPTLIPYIEAIEVFKHTDNDKVKLLLMVPLLPSAVVGIGFDKVIELVIKAQKER
jgi:hypothetical protein